MERDLIRRQVRFNHRRAKSNSERCEYWFLIINQNREIEEIQQRIYNLFMPIEEEGCKLEGVIKRTGLRYKVINFESKKRVEPAELHKIYEEVIADPRLYRRRGKDGLEKYVRGVIDSEGD